MGIQQGDELTFDELSNIFRVNGMEEWDGNMIANAFNTANEMQIEYAGDSTWRVVNLGDPNW